MDWDLTLGRAKAGFFQVLGLGSMAESAYVDLLKKHRDIGAARALAYLLAKSSRMADAEKWFARIAEWEPDNAENWFNLGYLRDSLGMKREALKAFENAVRCVPNFDRAWHAIGMMHIALGEKEQALPALRKACELQPKNAQGLLNLAQTLLSCDNKERELRNVVEKLAGVDRVLTRQFIETSGRNDFSSLLETPKK
jgi:tetratricopeptide (TPR) repeat protein